MATRGREATRDRLVQAAARLFYVQGIHATGVEAVIAEAGVSKPALYQHFSSKEALVRAVLELRDANRRARMEQEAARAANPAGSLCALFDWLVEWTAEEDFRGCALVNAAAETSAVDSPRLEVAREHKRWVRTFMARLARGSGCKDPEPLAARLLLLMEGAVALALVEHSTAPAEEARRAAQELIAAALEAGNGPGADSRLVVKPVDP